MNIRKVLMGIFIVIVGTSVSLLIIGTAEILSFILAMVTLFLSIWYFYEGINGNKMEDLG